MAAPQSVVHGGTLVARTLETLGARFVFGLCGDHVNPIFDALADSGVRLVDLRDERGAAFCAEGWALSAGTPGFACVTAGPGLANAIGPLADCSAWGVPVVVVAGRSPVRESDRGRPGEMPQIEMVRPVTKSARTVLDPARIPEYLARAFADAVTGRPGPAFVEIPIDVQSKRCEAPPAVRPPTVGRPAPSGGDLARAIEVLAAARKPVLIGGSGLWWSGAGRQLRAFAEAQRVPVLLKGAARGLLDESSHELAFGLPNPLFGAAAVALAEADAYLVAGTRLDLHLADGGFVGEGPAVLVDVAPETHTLGAGTVPLVCDAAEGLAALTAACPPPPAAREDWIGALAEARGAYTEHLAARASERGTSGVHPARMAGSIRAVCGPDTTVVVDAGELGLYAFEMLPACGPGSLLIGINSPLGGLGPGVPFAIAAALARPERRVVLLTGDGSLGFGAMELATAARLGLGIDVVVGNDREWGIIAHMQDLLHGRRTATALGDVDYAGLARALGCDGERVDGDDDVTAILDTRAHGRPRLVDVRLDRDVMHPLCTMIAPMFAEQP